MDTFLTAASSQILLPPCCPSNRMTSTGESSSHAVSASSTPAPPLGHHESVSPTQVLGVVENNSTGACSLWRFFWNVPTKKDFAKCKICNSFVNITTSRSTSRLGRHMSSFHTAQFREYLDSKVATAPTTGKRNSDGDIRNFTELLPSTKQQSFESSVLDWVIDKYVPYSMVESPSFREMVSHGGKVTTNIKKQVIKLQLKYAL